MVSAVTETSSKSCIVIYFSKYRTSSSGWKICTFGGFCDWAGTTAWLLGIHNGWMVRIGLNEKITKQFQISFDLMYLASK